jgi:hypothetical protein
MTRQDDKGTQQMEGQHAGLYHLEVLVDVRPPSCAMPASILLCGTSQGIVSV